MLPYTANLPGDDMTDEAADFDADIDKMEKIAKVIKEFDSPDVQALAYATLAARAFGTPLPSRTPETRVVDDPRALGDVVDLDADTGGDSTHKRRAPGKKAPAKKAPSKRAGKKLTYAATKDINFAPSGKTSWRGFATEKKPGNNFEKALVAVYYMRKTLERTVSTGDVIAAFNAMGWRNPTDPGNNLQQAGSRGWLNTADSSAIDLVWAGQNYVEHDLPKASKSKK
jgi:hypothetical protein